MHREPLYTELEGGSLLEPQRPLFEKDNLNLLVCSWHHDLEAIPQHVNAVLSKHISALPDCTEKTNPVSSKSHFQMTLPRVVSKITNIHKTRRTKGKLIPQEHHADVAQVRIFKWFDFQQLWAYVSFYTGDCGVFCSLKNRTHTHMYLYIYIFIYKDIHTWESNFMLPGANILTLVFCTHLSHGVYLHNIHTLNKHIVLLIAQRCYFPYNRHYLPCCTECLP